MTYSQYQLDIFRACEKGQDNLIIEAGPGCAKSTTLIKACEHVKKSKVGVFSFSKLLAEENAQRVPWRVESLTLNALGNRIVKENSRNIKVNKFKDWNILKTEVDEETYYKLRNPIDRMIGLLKNDIVVDNISEHISRLLKFHNLELPAKYDNGQFEEILEKVYIRSLNEIHREISLDDQKLIVVRYQLDFAKYDVGLFDESQDFSPLDVAFCDSICERKIFVGDRFQCQPEGTLVTVVKNMSITQVPIEQLKIDDKVVSWHEKCKYWSKSERVKDVSWREYEGELICIKTDDGHISKYTPNHKCITKFYLLTGSYCVYLMKKGNNYRVGKTKLNYGQSGNGVLSRLRAEKGDAIWILTIHETSEEAYLEEQYISHTFNIPQMVFMHGNKSLMKQEKIDWFWDYCGNNEDEANKCLKNYGRVIKYPLFSKEKISPWQDSLKRTMITEACNLMDNCLVLPFNKDDLVSRTFYLHEWRKIEITREKYEGKVYSLSITGGETYVADRILTHNSIYSFKGSMPSAMDEIKEKFHCEELILPICYRCPELVIEEARKINSRLESPVPNLKGKGIVETINKEKFREIVSGRDMVLCRITPPLIKECLKMLPFKPCYVKGRKIGESLEKLVGMVALNNNINIEDFDRKLDDYFNQQNERLNKLDRQETLSELSDKVESLKALEEKCNNTDELIELIKSIIVDNGKGIAYMTGHKSKGLEGQNIFLLRMDKIPHPRAKTDIQLQQEMNLKYVMITRSQSSLRYVEKERDER